MPAEKASKEQLSSRMSALEKELEQTKKELSELEGSNS